MKSIRSTVSHPRGIGARRGWMDGAMLYLQDLLLTALVQSGPSTEILVCKKREA